MRANPLVVAAACLAVAGALWGLSAARSAHKGRHAARAPAAQTEGTRSVMPPAPPPAAETVAEEPPAPPITDYTHYREWTEKQNMAAAVRAHPRKPAGKPARPHVTRRRPAPRHDVSYICGWWSCWSIH